jgi:hypothetical protein
MKFVARPNISWCCFANMISDSSSCEASSMVIERCWRDAANKRVQLKYIYNNYSSTIVLLRVGVCILVIYGWSFPSLAICHTTLYYYVVCVLCLLNFIVVWNDKAWKGNVIRHYTCGRMQGEPPPLFEKGVEALLASYLFPGFFPILTVHYWFWTGHPTLLPR